jgi:hypothetical protein
MVASSRGEGEGEGEGEGSCYLSILELADDMFTNIPK